MPLRMVLFLLLVPEHFCWTNKTVLNDATSCCNDMDELLHVLMTTDPVSTVLLACAAFTMSGESTQVVVWWFNSLLSSHLMQEEHAQQHSQDAWKPHVCLWNLNECNKTGWRGETGQIVDVQPWAFKARICCTVINCMCFREDVELAKKGH